MIRAREFAPPLWYQSDEIAAAIPTGFYARLEAALGDRWELLARPLRAAFVKDWGRPTDPVVYLKCYLIGYFENITYDTDLAERVADSISLRTFLGYTLTERTPDHSSLSHVRQLVGKKSRVIEEVLKATVMVCAQEGLVDGKETAVDGSLLPANASLSSLRSLKTGKSVQQHLTEVRARNRERAEGEPKEPTTLSNQEFRSRTDPDAKIARKPGTPTRLCHRVTHVTDGLHQIIVAAQGGDAEEGEAEAAKGPLRQAERNLRASGLALERVTGDAQYDAAELHAHIESLGGRPVTHTQKEGSRKPKGFRKADFSYLPETDCYRCPAERLLFLSRRNGERLEYRAEPGVCEACAHQQACAGGKSQRRAITRSLQEASRERNAAVGATEEGRALLKRRGQIVEAPFGHLKTYGGMGRLNCRGRPKVHVKVVLAAAAWNLIKLVGALYPKRPPRLSGAEAAGRCQASGGGGPAARGPGGLPEARAGEPRSQRGLPRTPFWHRAATAIASWLPPQLRVLPSACMFPHPLFR